ncbi:MAG: sulfotransferase [Candidatus Thermoplasmatota archaeon]|nr:sulfotransferase [Candidatus Thermoplasmatota archaeon]
MDRSQQFLHFHQQPFAGGSLSNWLRMLTRNRFRVSPVYVARAAYVSLLSTVTALPRLVEHRYDGLVAGQDVSPVFILGHFRSGTTFLHTLMSHDPSLGYMSTFQTMLPGNFIWKAGLFKRILADSLPETRPMDNVEMAADYPYEEEYAVANICPYSFYHGWYFPRRMRHYFDRYALMQAPSHEIAGWKTIYDYLLRKVAYATGQPRLLLKNPCNTARVKELLELYPDAKFVHIYRNPYHVFFSTRRLYDNILPLYALQEYDRDDVTENILYCYRAMYDRFFEQRSLIPDGNLVEIRYEDFVARPLDTLRDIYTRLNLPHFEGAEQPFADYVASQRDYTPRRYDIGRDMQERIYRHWHPTVDRWKYEPGGRKKAVVAQTA